MKNVIGVSILLCPASESHRTMEEECKLPGKSWRVEARSQELIVMAVGIDETYVHIRVCEQKKLWRHHEIARMGLNIGMYSPI